MRQYKCPDKQQHNNAKPFPTYVVVIEEVENYYMNASNMVHEPGICI